MRIRQVPAGYHGLVNYVQAMAPASIALSRALTAAGDIWSVQNLIDEAVVISGANKTITLTLAGGDSPNWQPNDVMGYWISEA